MKFQDSKHYDEFAFAQKIAANDLINRLKIHKDKFDMACEIGCGSGILTKLALANLNISKLILNDIYKNDFMRNFPCLIGSVASTKLPCELDLIISSSALQWVEDLAGLSSKFHQSLKSGGILAISLFSKGNITELSSFTKQGLNYFTKDEIAQIFKDKFEILEISNSSTKLKFNSLKELLNHLKQTGVNNVKGDFKLTKTSFKELEKHFLGDFGLTYEFTTLISKVKK